jgi:hypothetical protein
MVKKMILMLIAARILTYLVNKKEFVDKKKTRITIIGVLAYVWNDAMNFAICDDLYW